MVILVSNNEIPNRVEALLLMKHLLAAKPSNEATFAEAFVMTTIVTPQDSAIYTISNVRTGTQVFYYGYLADLEGMQYKLPFMKITVELYTVA
jgi:hypothetical protein